VTERKPPGVSWETWIDRQIREGMESGSFDDLPLTGRPIPGLDRPRDEMWWVRDKLRRENVSYLPPTLAIRKELEDTLAKVGRTERESEVRELIEAINAKIRKVNSTATAGPASTLMPLDVDQVVDRWRTARAS
jgi:hypothetical protein